MAIAEPINLKEFQVRSPISSSSRWVTPCYEPKVSIRTNKLHFVGFELVTKVPATSNFDK